LQGKGLIFVNDVNKCYKLKLFLQQFYISAAVLNAELPANSRMHILEEYNRGVFDYLIATDAVVDHGEEDESDEEEDAVETRAEKEVDEDDDEDESVDDEEEDEEEDEENSEAENVEEDSEEEEDMEDSDGCDDEEDDSDLEEDPEEEDEESEDDEPTAKTAKEATKKKRKASSEDSGYGVSRGIDFQGVSFVINFDFPASSAAYTHRIGRTARGGASGTALSFVSTCPIKSSTTLLEGKAAQLAQIAEADEAMLQLVRSQQPRLGGDSEGSTNVLANIGGPQEQSEEDWEQNLQPAPLQFNMKELDNFRYRVEDTLRSVTGNSVNELRAAELKREILNSSQLKSFFAANPTDLKVLRHDKAVMHPIKQKEHLKNIPEYLVPASMRGVANSAKKKKKRKLQAAGGQSQEKRRAMSKSKDPLFSGSSAGTTSGASKSPAVTKERVYTTGDTLGHTTAGRQKWKMSHGKGKFSKHKGSNHGVQGSFTKTKGYR